MELSLFCAKQTPDTLWTSTAAACMRPPRSMLVVIPRSRDGPVSSDRARGESRPSAHSSTQNANQRARQLGAWMWALREQCLAFASGPRLLRVSPADAVVVGKTRAPLARLGKCACTRTPRSSKPPIKSRPNLGCGASVPSSAPKSRSSISDSCRFLHADVPPPQGPFSMAARDGQAGVLRVLFWISEKECCARPTAGTDRATERLLARQRVRKTPFREQLQWKAMHAHSTDIHYNQSIQVIVPGEFFQNRPCRHKALWERDKIPSLDNHPLPARRNDFELT